MSAAEERERLHAAAIGQSGWGQMGSTTTDRRYLLEIDGRSRVRCGCGCKKRAAYVGCVNGLGMTSGCELSMRRWVRDGYAEVAR